MTLDEYKLGWQYILDCAEGWGYAPAQLEIIRHVCANGMNTDCQQPTIGITEDDIVYLGWSNVHIDVLPDGGIEWVHFAGDATRGSEEIESSIPEWLWAYIPKWRKC